MSFKFRDDGPILFRHEHLDFALALHDHAQGHSLNASGRNSAPDFIPKQRADLVSHEPVENPARLLRVDDMLVDAARILDGRANRLRRDLIKKDAEHFGLVAVEDFLEVLANRFAFAVRVSGEQNAIRGPGGSAQFLDDFFFSGYDFVDRLEMVLDIDAELALRQVLDVAERGLHDEFLAEIFIDRVRFRG